MAVVLILPNFEKINKFLISIYVAGHSICPFQFVLSCGIWCYIEFVGSECWRMPESLCLVVYFILICINRWHYVRYAKKMEAVTNMVAYRFFYLYFPFIARFIHTCIWRYFYCAFYIKCSHFFYFGLTILYFVVHPVLLCKQTNLHRPILVCRYTYRQCFITLFFNIIFLSWQTTTWYDAQAYFLWDVTFFGRSSC